MSRRSKYRSKFFRIYSTRVRLNVAKFYFSTIKCVSAVRQTDYLEPFSRNLNHTVTWARDRRRHQSRSVDWLNLKAMITFDWGFLQNPLMYMKGFSMGWMTKGFLDPMWNPTWCKTLEKHFTNPVCTSVVGLHKGCWKTAGFLRLLVCGMKCAVKRWWRYNRSRTITNWLTEVLWRPLLAC